MFTYWTLMVSCYMFVRCLSTNSDFGRLSTGRKPSADKSLSFPTSQPHDPIQSIVTAIQKTLPSVRNADDVKGFLDWLGAVVRQSLPELRTAGANRRECRDRKTLGFKFRPRDEVTSESPTAATPIGWPPLLMSTVVLSIGEALRLCKTEDDMSLFLDRTGALVRRGLLDRCAAIPVTSTSGPTGSGNCKHSTERHGTPRVQYKLWKSCRALSSRDGNGLKTVESEPRDSGIQRIAYGTF